MSELTLSKYQKDIIDTFKKTKDNLFIEALAGSGKTFILVELSKYVDTYSVFIAFNKSIQEELKNRITNPKFKTYTFNGLGYMIMNNNWDKQENEKKKNNPDYKVKKLVVDTYKTKNIVANYFKDSGLNKTMDEESYLDLLESTSHLYDLCRQRLVNINDYDEIMDTIDFYNLYDGYIPNDLCNVLNELMKEDIRLFKEDGIIDFIDQIFITYMMIKQDLWQLEYYHRFENLFVDECLPGNIYITCLDNNVEKRISIKNLYKKYINNQELPLVKSFNHNTEEYEFKSILNVKKHANRKIYEIKTEGLNKIKATDNHKFLTQRGYVEVKDLIIGQDILCLDKIYNQKTKFLLNDDQLQVAWASSIGDGHLEKRSKLNTYRIKFSQGEKQKKYLDFKVNLFHSSPPYKTKSGYCDNIIYQSQTNTFIMFEDIWNGIEKIDERFLAIWYQDDGSAFYTKKGLFTGCRIACNNLNIEKIQKIIDVVYNKFNILLEIISDKKYFSIKMNKENSVKFLKLIAPYMHPTLAYKNIFFDENNLYKWDNNFKNYGGNFITEIKECGYDDVYDMEVQDNHNFICCLNQNSTGIISHNCQDLSKLQQLFIGLLRRRKESRYVFVGDKFQAIYSFAGSDCHSTDSIKRLYKTKSLELPINYRCPVTHLSFVNREYDIPIQPCSTAKDGTIKKIDYDKICNHLKEGDCILSRKNSDLCRVALLLLDNDFSIYIRDESLVNKLIKKISSFKNQVKSLEELPELLEDITSEYEKQLEEQMEKIMSAEDTQITEVVKYSDNNVDLLDCVKVLLDKYIDENENNKVRLKSFESFINYVRQRLCTTQTKNSIQCVSIHQAKGKEYDRVFILNNNKIFNELARSDDQRQQEKNLAYIAMTRSKDSIYLVSPCQDDEYDSF